MGFITRRLLSPPRRVVRWTSEHPLRTAGGVAALAASLVAALSTDAADGAASLTVLSTALADFAAAHPAYPVAVVVGLAVLLFAR